MSEKASSATQGLKSTGQSRANKVFRLKQEIATEEKTLENYEKAQSGLSEWGCTHPSLVQQISQLKSSIKNKNKELGQLDASEGESSKAPVSTTFSAI